MITVYRPERNVRGNRTLELDISRAEGVFLKALDWEGLLGSLFFGWYNRLGADREFPTIDDCIEMIDNHLAWEVPGLIAREAILQSTGWQERFIGDLGICQDETEDYTVEFESMTFSDGFEVPDLTVFVPLSEARLMTRMFRVLPTHKQHIARRAHELLEMIQEEEASMAAYRRRHG